MHIELTDHLRCPQPHEEAFLVLLPDVMAGRRVVAGHLGCPVCGWSTEWQEGTPDFGNGVPGTGSPAFDASAALALLGLDGPGGWVAFAGRAGALAEPFTGLLHDVRAVAINPASDMAPSEMVSVIRSGPWPLKQHSMRGVVLGLDAAEHAAEALGSLLPGLRMVGEGALPSFTAAHQVDAASPEAWVVRRR